VKGLPTRLVIVMKGSICCTDGAAACGPVRAQVLPGVLDRDDAAPTLDVWPCASSTASLPGSSACCVPTVPTSCPRMPRSWSCAGSWRCSNARSSVDTRFTWPDRAPVALFSGFVSRERWRGFLVTPQTVLDWHRRLVKKCWAHTSVDCRRPRGRCVPTGRHGEWILQHAAYSWTLQPFRPLPSVSARASVRAVPAGPVAG
jgi:hypothetical protein